jgi:hypothetical protein
MDFLVVVGDNLVVGHALNRSTIENAMPFLDGQDAFQGRLLVFLDYERGMISF